MIARRVRTLVDSAFIFNKLKKSLYKVKPTAYDYPKEFSLESSHTSKLRRQNMAEAIEYINPGGLPDPSHYG